MSKRLSELGYASPRNRTYSRAPSAMLVCAAMLLAPLFALVPLVASDPIDTDNPDYTGMVTWDFSTPEDYETVDVTIEDGVAGLSPLNESVTENSKADYANGTMVNLDDATAPDSLILDETSTSSTVLELQPDAATGQDSYIYEDRENENYGTERELRIDSETSKVYRILFRFDFPTIPAGAYVNEATLWLYQNSGGKGDDLSFSIHALNRSFVEEEVTWNKCSTSAFWTSPGGDFSTQAYVAGVLNNSDDWKSFDVSNLVECWIRGTIANNGLIMVPSESPSDSVKEFVSSDEESWPELRPRLSIDYTVQGNEGAYESGVLGPGTNCTFTTADWTNGSLSLLDDEFAQAPLSAKWTWWNDPIAGGGSYNVGLTTPGWLHVLGSPNSMNRNTTIGSNYLYQEVTGDFDAMSSIVEFFTVDYMHAGILLVDNNGDWVSISKTGVDSDGEIVVILCENGVSSTVASVAWQDLTTARLRIVRDSAGIRLYAGEVGNPWTEVHDLSGISTLKQKLKIGLFISSGSGAQPQAEFGYFRVEPLEAPTFQVMLRTGNSSSLSDPSWNDWTSPFLERGTVLWTTAKYIRYRIYIATDYEWLTPIFSGFTVHWERHAPYGLVETADYTPADFSSWLSFNAIHDSSGGSVDYYFSTDGGDSWDFLTSDTTTTLYSLEQTMRIRAVLATYDTLTSTSVDEFSVTYGTALSAFFVVAPSTVTAGDTFTLDLWAKNSENQTLTNWIGTVSLTAMDSTGTVETASDLEIVSEDVASAGHATVENQRYYSAETICIRVDSEGVIGVSAPVEVRAGPITSLKMLPEDLDSVQENCTIVLEAVATDEYGNAVPGKEYVWTVSEDLGQLNSTTGTPVMFTPGKVHSTGYINVTCEGFSISRFMTVECVGHPPVFLSDIPVQMSVEDGPTWSYDLAPHVADSENNQEYLRWFVTGEELVTVSNENKTGNLILTLTPLANMFGKDTLRLFVVDPEGESTSVEMTVQIEPVNDAPTIEAVPHLVVHYDDLYLFSMRHYVDDIDNDDSQLSLSVDKASEPYVIVDSTTLSLFFTYPYALIGTTQIAVVTVSDGSLESATTIRVSISDDNPPVQTESLPSVVLRQGEALVNVFDLDNHFIDIDGDSLYYAASEAHVFVNISETNEVSIYASFDWSGEEFVVFSATDPQGARAEGVVHVTVLPVNQAPWICNLPDLRVRFDKRFEFDVARYVGDEDDTVDSLIITTNDSHVAVIGTTLSMLYPESLNGTVVSIEVTVSDGEFTDSWATNVTISDNSPPESFEPPDHSFTEDWPIPYPTSGGLLTWFDDEEDGKDIAIEAFCWCEEITATVVENAFGQVSLRFYTEQDYNGETMITLRATDTEGALVEDTIALTVTSVPDAPVFDILQEFAVTADVEVSYDLSKYVTDPDSELTQMNLVVSSEYSEYIAVASTLVRMHFPESFLGSSESSKTVDVEIRIVDQDGLWGTSTMRITVSRSTVAQAVGSWNLMPLLVAAGVSLGLFGMVLSMRKKPFIIRDMMLVHKDGFLISRHEAVDRDDMIDEDIFTGMLTAVLNFVEDSMASDQEHLRFFGFEHYRIMIKRGGMAYAAIVFEGDRPKNIDSKLGVFLEKVEKIYRKNLQDWTGDIDVDFAGAHLMIEAFVKENNGRKLRGLNGRNGLKNGDAEPSEADDASDSQSKPVAPTSEGN